MRVVSTFSFSVALLVSLTFAFAGEVKEAPALMTVRGKVLLTEDFSGTALPEGWKTLKGTWTVADGTLKGVELASDMHPGVVGVNLPAHDIVAQFDFRFDGAKSTAFSLNNTGGHVCRVTVTPTGFTLTRDRPKKTSEEKTAQLARVAMPFTGGQWYTMVVEVRAGDMVASVGDKVGFGSNPGINADKTSLHFPVSGDSISIAHVRVWEATANPNWEATKEKLEASKKEAASAK